MSNWISITVNVPALPSIKDRQHLLKSLNQYIILNKYVVLYSVSAGGETKISFVYQTLCSQSEIGKWALRLDSGATSIVITAEDSSICTIFIKTLTMKMMTQITHQRSPQDRCTHSLQPGQYMWNYWRSIHGHIHHSWFHSSTPQTLVQREKEKSHQRWHVNVSKIPQLKGY